MRKAANKSTQYMTQGVTYSSGQKPRGVSEGKSGSTSMKVGNKAGLSESINRSGCGKGASPFKQGGRA